MTSLRAEMVHEKSDVSELPFTSTPAALVPLKMIRLANVLGYILRPVPPAAACRNDVSDELRVAVCGSTAAAIVPYPMSLPLLKPWIFSRPWPSRASAKGGPYGPWKLP